MAIDFDQLWEPSDDDSGGVSAEAIANWEAKHGVKMPQALAEALRRRDGGVLRHSTVQVYALDEMTPTQSAWLAGTGASEGVADGKLVFTFAEDSSGEGPIYVLNYNALGPAGEPTVHCMNSDLPEFTLEAKTIADFLAAQTAASENPAVDWSETARLDSILHHETVKHVGPTHHEELVLGRLGPALVLFTHNVSPDEESYMRTTIPEPLNPWFAFIFKFPPFTGAPYVLHLSPRDPAGMISITAMRTNDGKWKTTTEHGFPISVDVSSSNLRRLRTLRRTLLGKQAVLKTTFVLAGSLAIIVCLGVLAYVYR